MFDRRRNAASKKLWQMGLVCLLGVAMLGANQSNPSNQLADPSARFGRIGRQMMCVCSCGQVLLECNHVGCPDSKRMIGELHDLDDSGGPGGADSLILNWFVAKYGATVLAAPIRGGFDNVAWIVPIAMFLVGTLGTAMIVRIWAQRRRPALVAGLQVDPVVRDDVRDRIRRETEWR